MNTQRAPQQALHAHPPDQATNLNGNLSAGRRVNATSIANTFESPTDASAALCPAERS
jgi:hypothetical protein